MKGDWENSKYPPVGCARRSSLKLSGVFGDCSFEEDEGDAINTMSLIITHVRAQNNLPGEACGMFTVGRSATTCDGNDSSCNEIDLRTGGKFKRPTSSTDARSMTMTGRSEDESEAFLSRCIDFLTAENEAKRGVLLDETEGLRGGAFLLGPNGRRERSARKPETPVGVLGEEGPGVLKEGRLAGVGRREELLDVLVGIDDGVCGERGAAAIGLDLQ